MFYDKYIFSMKKKNGMVSHHATSLPPCIQYRVCVNIEMNFFFEPMLLLTLVIHIARTRVFRLEKHNTKT